MSKKHFVGLAAALAAEKPGSNWNPNKMVQWELDCKAIATFCQSQNAQFDRERFLAACSLVASPSSKELCLLCGEYKHKPGQRC